MASVNATADCNEVKEKDEPVVKLPKGKRLFYMAILYLMFCFDLAIRYGYQRRVPSMMWVTVVFLIVLVQVIQYVFSRVSTRIDKRLK